MTLRSRHLIATTSSAAIVAAGMAVAASPATAAGHLECGDTIVVDTVLTSDLICDGTTDALRVGADDIVLDLGGYTISGPGAYLGTGSGIRITGHSGVTLQKGTVTGFESGVVIDSGPDNTVTKIRAVANDRGVDLANAPRAVVTKNTLEDNGRDGVAVGGSGSGGSMVAQNSIIGNTWGVTVNAAPDVTVSRNTIDGNDYGVAVFGGAAQTLVTQNWVTNSVFHGIETTVATDFVVSRNTSADNGGYGLRLWGTGLVEKNTAYGNGAGDFLFGPGVVDGGGNTTPSP